MDIKTKRVRMLRSLATGHNLYEQGRTYRVPEDLPAHMAQSWLDVGAAEEDKMIDGAPETKAKKKTPKKS
jgi:hypothetical protein